MTGQPTPVDPAVAAVMEVLGCQRWVPAEAPPQCWTHLGRHVAAPWTDRGCPVAVKAADAARPHHQAQALRDAAEGWGDGHEGFPFSWLNDRADRIEAGP